MRVLVTNDDGVRAPGLAALARRLDEHGYDVMICAPSDDRSGYGAAVGPLHVEPALHYQEVSLSGLAHVPTFAVDAPPAAAVLAGCFGGFGRPPQLVVAGVNAGANTGTALLHSGTVGAALTAANLGRPALAVSLALAGPGGPESAPEPAWGTAVAVAVAMAGWVIVGDRPTVFNVNVPDRPLQEVRGVRSATLGHPARPSSGFVVTAPGRLSLERWDAPEPEPDTDRALLAAGYVAVTELLGISSAAPGSVDALPSLVEEQVLRGLRTAER